MLYSYNILRMPKEKPNLGQPLFELLEEKPLPQKKQNKPAPDPYVSLFEGDPQAEILGPVNTDIIRERINKNKRKH